MDLNLGPNTACEYYPCHFVGQDCSLCFCPLYPCLDERLGMMVPSRKGGRVWSCEGCYWTHRREVASELARRIKAGERPPPREKLVAVKNEVEALHPVSACSIMVLGTTSGAGKTITAAALCRILSDMGMNVAPFKSQNMSLNSVVTANGGEISRAQALQAAAARTEPDASMNPILLKPKRDDISQVIIEGRPYRDMDVTTYYNEFVTGEGIEAVKRAWDFLRRTRDAVVIEGAGSPAEINLSDIEIANMRTAEIALAPCILVVNMEWGGGFAYAYGTVMLLPPERRAMVKGIVLNNMDGDISCLKNGIEELEGRTGIPVLGVVPHIEHHLPDEDSQDLGGRGSGTVRVGVIMLPRISNFTDFDALALDGATIDYIRSPEELASADAVIIPGTKNTVADLQWLKDKGLADRIIEMRGKVPILGICGGYQMLGRELLDPHGLEGGSGESYQGLGLLDITTSFDTYDKTTVQVQGRMSEGGEVRGYEIHMGCSSGNEASLFLLDRPGTVEGEGSVSSDGMVMGTYVHGLFDLPAFRSLFLSKARGGCADGSGIDLRQDLEDSLDRLAEVFKKNLDIDRVLAIMKEGL